MPVKPGGVGSLVHVTVRDIVAVLPQPSVAVNVLVCDLIQVPVTAPSACVMVGVLQPSVAVADPSDAVIVALGGLHPNATMVYVPVKVGAVGSSVQVTVLDIVVVLPQPSVAVNVLV